MNLKNRKNKGFTLAETLITMGIIGVVAALTIPTLMNKWQRDAYSTQLKQVYSMFSQAITQFQTDRMSKSLLEGGLRSQGALNTFMTTYFRSVEACASQSDCLASQYTKLAGNQLNWSSSANYRLANGATVGLIYNGGNQATGSSHFYMLVDTNGKEAPNILGRDAFVIYVYTDGTIGDQVTDTAPPHSKSDRETEFNDSCKGETTAWNGCFGHMLNTNFVMDY